MDLSFRDTQSRQIQTLGIRRGRSISMYVCGPTVYAPCHVGHARTYLLFDIIKRFVEGQGCRVRHVQNVTDFEDKITQRATAQGITWKALARREEEQFHRDLGALGIRPPERSPRSSEFVREMIGVIRLLERRGMAYRKNGAVYFDASAVPGGSSFGVDELLSAHAVPEEGHTAMPEAADPRDFVLWKPTQPPSPVWSSPWGPGMPGWHIECFVMAQEYLPLPMDLHGGGLDLIFPHHYAENLLSLAVRGTPISRHYIHGAFVTMGSRKMSKSVGNLVPLRQALQELSPGGLRSYLLSRGYQEPLEYVRDMAREWDATWREDQRVLQGLFSPSAGSGYPRERLESTLHRIPSLLAQNLDTPTAFQALHQLAEDIRAAGRGALASGDRAPARRAFRKVENLLGVEILPRSAQ
jgi:cysteinyl-tRNA synthetase